jgi:hypothetical protein
MNLLNYQKKAEIILFLFIIFLGTFFLMGAGRLLVFPFPIISFLIGLFLYLRVPSLYISFTIFMWFLSPFVRRLIDYQSGDFTMGGYDTAAHFVSLISIITFVRELPRSFKGIGLNIVLSFAIVIYGLVIGLFKNQIYDFTIVEHFFSMAMPILFGFHVFSSWESYPKLCSTILKTFYWGILIVSSYGIIQYIFAPEWDKFFLKLGIIGAQGDPEPFGIRVFSTMAGAHNLAPIISSGLLLLMISGKRNLQNYLVIVIGVTCLALTSVRSSWLCLILGIFLYFLAEKRPKYHMNITISISICFLISLVSFSLVPGLSDLFLSRFNTFFNSDDDFAFNYRISNYEEALAQDSSFLDLFGYGFGISPENVSGIFLGDSAFLPILFYFGIIGGIIFLVTSLIWLPRSYIYSVRNHKNDFFYISSSIISLSLLPMLFSSPLFHGAGGLIYWMFLGLSFSALKYYSNQYQ